MALDDYRKTRDFTRSPEPQGTAPARKKAGADFAEILSEGTPDLWTCNPPAKTGDTGKMFQAIIARALEMKASKATTKGAKDTKSTTLKSKRPKPKA